ncbi:HNH endonuclease [Moritella viscosa]|uniref:HNH endonuclease n=1 Tax=Moritella viscosa TaxID=80854 RepID=UPI00094C47C5
MAIPSCKQIATNKGRCAAHQRKERPKEHSRTSTTRNNDIYNSTKWKRLRARKLKANPICEECLTYNVVTPTDIIDHVIEINDNSELAYCYSNLRSLCHSCHNTKTAKAKKDRTKVKTISSSDLFKQLGL